MAERNSFVVYTDWYDYIKELETDEERSRLFLALFEYKTTGKQPVDFKGALKIVFLMMKSALDRDSAKYEEVCEKRANGGSKGGAPKGNQNARKNNHKVDFKDKNNHKVDLVVSKQPNQAKQPDNDNETDNENDNDNDNETETDNDNDVMLTEAEHDALVAMSSSSSVEKYIQKIVNWQRESGKCIKDPYKTIKGWIAEDKKKGVLKEPSGTPASKEQKSYDLDEWERYALNFGMEGNTGQEGSS